MNDQMNELVQFSPFAGKLTLIPVAGAANKKIEHENDAHAADGAERTMYAYAPVSGCPDPKQGQVLMVLRSGTDEQSAAAALKQLGLTELAEQEHFLVLLPNPQSSGWNYKEDNSLDNDADFLGRCFACLRGSELGVNGFNGMIYYIAACEAASALLMNMTAHNPISVPAMMIGAFPDDYAIPTDAPGVETAAWVMNNPPAEAYLKKANGVTAEQVVNGDMIYMGANPNCRLAVSSKPLSADSVLACWDQLFSLSRRWQNDTHGTYQKRTFFTERGFIAHVKDSSLGDNNGFAHTWYEYVPPQLRGSDKKVPLVFYFHGVNAVPLYGAEQCGWQEVADREEFILVYPAPAVYKAWNIFNDPSLPSDFDYVMALIAHMKAEYAIDETKIYATGFSMGGMMTHAITAAYPRVFAAGAPCNAFDFAYFKTPAQVYSGVVKGADPSILAPQSAQHAMADAAQAAGEYRMPIFQNAGFNDGLIAPWPVTENTDDVRTKTIARWLHINNCGAMRTDAEALSGLKADESFYEDAGQRFFHQRWHSADEGAPVLYELLIAKRMPHAITHTQLEYAWRFLKRFRRLPDGTLDITE